MIANTGERQQQVCEWLRANGIDPDVVPINADMKIVGTGEERQLRCEEYVHDEQGHLVIDERGQWPATRSHLVPLTVEPPEWWQPHVKPTRERLLEAVAAVSQLHIRNQNSGTCEHCSERDYPGYAVPWPCPTINALGNTATPTAPTT